MQPSAVLLAGVFAVSLSVSCGGSAEPPRSPGGDSPPAGSASPVAATTPDATPQPGGDQPKAEPALPTVELVEIDAPASPAKMPVLTISSPARGQVVPAGKVAELPIQIGVRGWDLSPGKEHLCVSLDAGPCFRIDDAKQVVKLSDVSAKLEEGQHVLAVVARHPSGEAVRSKGKSAAFAAVSFFVGKRGKVSWKDGDPLILSLGPEDGAPARSGELLIDYYVGNAEVADGKYLAQIALAGPGLNRGESSSTGRPFRVKNARAGGYLLRVALARYSPELGESGSSTTVKYSSKTLVGPLVDVTRTFQVSN